MKLKQGPISKEGLMQSLAKAKGVMNKVDGGSYQKGNITPEMLNEDQEKTLPIPTMMEDQPNPNLHKAPGPITEDKVNQSKLPDNIKKAMLENPIQQISMDAGLDMSFVEQTKQLMGESGSRKAEQPIQQKQVQTESPQKKTVSSSELERRLTPIIENIIRKSIDDILDKKLDRLLSVAESKTINEGLAIKVGDSIFTGRLTKVKSTK
jgi:hypothetical protein